MATIKQLKEELENYSDETAIFWQFYTSEHAAIPESYFKEVAANLMRNGFFLEDLHDLISSWLAATYDELKKEGTKN